MTQLLLTTPRDSTIAASTTIYMPTGTGSSIAVLTNEANAQKVLRNGGVFSQLFTDVIVNGTSGNSTMKIRKNGADGNSVITIGAGATGEFTDTTNTDSFSAGDVSAIQIVSAAGGNLRWTQLTTLFAPTDGTKTINNMHLNGSSGNFSASSTNYYLAMSGVIEDQNGTIEADVQLKNKSVATLTNLFVSVATNAKAVSNTVQTRVNGANGALSVTIGAGATGVFEDTSNTDNLAVDDLINYNVVSGAGAATLLIATIACDYTTTNGTTHYVSSNNNPATVSIGSNIGISLGGSLQFNSSDVLTRTQLKRNIRLKNLQTYINTNGVTANSTFKSRINGVDGNNSITIGSGATGFFEDASNTDTIDPNDYVNIHIVAGGTGTSFLFKSASIQAEELVFLDKWEPQYPDIIWSKAPLIHQVWSVLEWEVVTSDKWYPDYPNFIWWKPHPIPPSFFMHDLKPVSEMICFTLDDLFGFYAT